MSEIELIGRVSKLPPKLRQEVSDFVDFLLDKHKGDEFQRQPLKFGMMKGTFVMQEDFDKPLDDFKDYMS